MKIERQIEFDKVKELWAGLAVTDQAKEKIREASIFLSENELRKQLRDTTDARNLIEKAGTPPLQNVSEARDILLSAAKEECLTPYQLERVEKVLAAIKRLKDYLERGRLFDNSLAYYDENLDAVSELREEICDKIRNGAVDDCASKELRQIRSQIVKCEEQMKQKAEQILRSHKEYMADNYCTFRNGRICVPVKKEYKLKIPGSVMDRSSTGNTIFIEPTGAAKYYEEQQLLKIGEENEEYRILYTLSALVSESAPVLRENLAMMEKLDFIFSKGKLSIDMDGTEPSVNTARRIRLAGARHPLMDKTAAVPLEFDIGEKVRGIVITGPNTGGKTVAMKTVMLNCVMAQCGLHVTCRQADICMNSSYLCDIGDGQNLSENLSTFSAHITNVLEVLGEAGKESFVIMDELGSGTDPAEGMGIAIAILEELKKTGTLFLVTTHYPEVKEYAARTEGMLNARMTFDKETLRPTYQMIIGEAGESCAFYIADRLGMPDSMLKAAICAAYGQEGLRSYSFHKPDSEIVRRSTGKITKAKAGRNRTELSTKFRIGDSVMVYPEGKIGIVCVPVNEKGVLRVQLPGKKIWINHKRVKLHVAAAELYPEDYDFSIVFDTARNRKKRHDMERKYTDAVIEADE
ncbi:MAG: DNA mismatch repair protein MutS [Hungatella sp.]|nr:DNA mismatch repair protein MutS [Hungatella sp.]